MSGKYDDIIHLPHPTSAKHPRMPISDRAAIFSPFAALTGHAGCHRGNRPADRPENGSGRGHQSGVRSTAGGAAEIHCRAAGGHGHLVLSRRKKEREGARMS